MSSSPVDLAGKYATRRFWCLHSSGYPYIVAVMNETTNAIADKVRGVAAEKRFTQQRMADALGISRTSVTERVHGRVPFTGAEIHSLSKVLDVPVNRFFPETSA